SVFVNEQYEIVDGLTVLADLQFQHRDYEMQQEELGNFRGQDRHAYQVAYDFFNPKGGLFWQLPGGKLGLYGHVGVAHREPSDADLFDTWQGADDLGVAPLFRESEPVYQADGVTVDYLQWSDPIVEEERAVNYEFGTAYRTGTVSFTLNAYLMEFENEIIPFGTVDDDGYGIKGNAGKTLHRGLEFGLTARPATAHRLAATFSRSWDEFEEFIFYDWDGTSSNYAGNPIALFPRYLGSLNWRADWGSLDSSLRWRVVGQQYLDNTGNEDRIIDGYSLVDISIGLDLVAAGLPELTGAKLDLRVRNVLDAEYETTGYYDTWGSENLKLPAAGRNYLVGVHYDF
ncbi:MAG: TonB-dependent receptor, partial [bacterium]